MRERRGRGRERGAPASANPNPSLDLSRRAHASLTHTHTQSSASNPTFTPRLLIFEEREGLGVGLSEGSTGGAAAAAAAAATSPGAWTGAITRAVAPSLPPSPWNAALRAGEADGEALASAASALSLTGGLTSWTDFLKAPVPPSCLAPVTPAWPRRGGSAGWGPPGGEAEADAASVAAEGVRRLAEACDRLQGLAILVDDTGGWGAAAAAALGGIAEAGAVGERAPRLVGCARPVGWWCGRGGGGAPACPDVAARTAAAAASAAFLAPLADAFIPFDLPPGTAGVGGGGDASSPASLFRSGAALAAAWEGLTTPARLGRGGPASASSGGADLAALASLVAGPRGHNRWGCVSVALPAPSAPPPVVPGERDGRAPAHPSPPPPFTATATSWTARIPPPDGSRARALLAESIVWRGPRGWARGDRASSSARLPLPAAAAALDVALGVEAAAASATAAGGVAVRHRCLAALGLPLPLPWPAGYPPGCSSSATTAPLLTRLACVRGVGAARAAAAADLAAAATGSAGRVALGPAGVDADALADGLESLGERGGGSSSEEEGGGGWSD